MLDLRPELEFNAGHLPDAVSCPLDQLSDRLKNLPTGKTLVLYCRGPLCLLADIAQEQLAARGIKALQFSDGVAEWASAGLPVKRSAGCQSLFPTATP